MMQIYFLLIYQERNKTMASKIERVLLIDKLEKVNHAVYNMLTDVDGSNYYDVVSLKIEKVSEQIDYIIKVLEDG